MSTNLTVNDLFKRGAIPIAAVHAAADTYLTHPGTGMLPLGRAYAVNVVAAVEADALARCLLRDPGVALPVKQAAARTAILLARPRER
ncbi:hypothetical protein [Methylobacterium nigriterrae]|uniref:hypothetical protein n=1 Tax=Methylobacterium nigriterrae TaxID=3127512 RepID=UPI0030136C42